MDIANSAHFWATGSFLSFATEESFRVQWVSRVGCSQSQYEARPVWILSPRREKDDVVLKNSTILLERPKLIEQYLYLPKARSKWKEYWVNKMIQQAGIILLLTWHLDWINILNLLSKQWSSKQTHLVLYWENPKCARLTWLSTYWALTILEHRSMSRAEELFHY